ncbi:MAG: hypothetical protein HZC55_16845 [Verrucomicrobia bacterium]|nr:hypothetical protein [Verrucomicrobiota bacterium]
MNSSQYHSVLMGLDRALHAFKAARCEVTPEDRQLVQQLARIRSQVLRAETGLPFSFDPLAPEPADPDTTQVPWQ